MAKQEHCLSGILSHRFESLLWGHLIQNRCILFFTDNEALVYIINKQSCRNRHLMFFVRKLVSVCLKYNILFKAKHVPGACNKLMDSLSCLQIHTFRQLAPAYMNPRPSKIPLHLQPQLLSLYNQAFSHPLYLLIKGHGHFSTNSYMIYFSVSVFLFQSHHQP